VRYPCNRMPYFVSFLLPTGGEFRAYKTRMAIHFVKTGNTDLRELIHIYPSHEQICNPTLRFLHLSVLSLVFHCLGRGGASGPNRLFGEGCLSRASSFAILFGLEAEERWRVCFSAASEGPRTGKNGFGHFCRNKSASSRGGETPHN